MQFFIKDSYQKHREIVHNFTWRALQIVGKQGITFFTLILCAHLLTPYDFGVYNYILGLVFLLILFSDFGISTATAKYVAEYSAIDKEKLNSIFFNSLILLVALSATITLLTLAFGSYFLKEKYFYVLYVLPMLFLSPISSLYDGIFRGLKKFKELALASMLVGLSLIVFIYFLIQKYGLIGALISQNLFYFLLVLSLSLAHGKTGFELDKELMKTIFNYSLTIGFSSIAYFLYSRVDILVLGYYGYVEEIGYYELINKGFELMFLPFALFAQVISPNVTSYFAKRDYLKVRNKLSFFMKTIIPVALIMALLFYYLFPLFIKKFLSEYYGKEMLAAVFILSFLIPAKIWGVFQTQCFIVATGFARIIAITTFIGGILNIIFDIVFIRWIGFTGVFLVTLVIHTLSIIVVSIWFRKNIGENYD